MLSNIFQSPPSVRKATYGWISVHDRLPISIPAFREEGDGMSKILWLISSAFQSPPSVRKATVLDEIAGQAVQFQSPPSVRKATLGGGLGDMIMSDFNPRLP